VTDIPFHWGVAVGLAISALIALFAPVAAAFAVHRRTGASFRYFALGAAVFFVSQVVLRFPWQIPLSVYVQKNPSGALRNAFLVFSALTAGLFEEGGRWLGYRFFIKKERSWRVGVMYGLGHGGLESILLVGVTLAGSLVLYVCLTRGIPIPIGPDKLELLRHQFSGLTTARSLLGGIERLFALCLQVGFSLVVLQAFLRNQLRWLAYAIALHFIVDLAAVTAAMRVGPLFGEIVAGAFAAGFLVLIARLRRVDAAGPSPAPDASIDAPAQRT
jgi:uncharacterized membrane protein YhfC